MRHERSLKGCSDMFLKWVSLSDVRSVDELTLDFSQGTSGVNRRWTVLLGENGCGKTTVLRCIALILAGSDALTELIGSPDAWIRNTKKSCSIKAGLQTADGQDREVQLVINRGDSIRDIFSRNEKALSALDAAIAHAQRNYFVLGYGVSRRPVSASSRLLSVPFEESRSTRALGLMTMFSTDSNLVSLEQWATDLEYRKGRSAITIIRKALDALLPDMRLSRIDRETKQLYFKTVDGEVPLAQLSDGYQSMAAWCGDLLYRITQTFPDRNDPMATRGVLLIDELDLHLHPKWQRLLVDFLTGTFPHLQFIATTHSALAAQQCGTDELYVIRREGAQQRPRLVPFVGEPRKMLLHQLLLSPMFGLQSLESVDVEESRNAARELASRKQRQALSGGEKKKLDTLKAKLAEVPDWDAVPPYMQQQMELVKSVRQALGKANAGRSAVSPRKLRTKLSALRSKS
jgi:energy-coupling factor transporter ATP-binding protein EcfA2